MIQSARNAANQQSLSGFVAGAYDQAQTLQISQKLYGRDSEVLQLQANFNSVCNNANSSSMLMLVHGYSGVTENFLESTK